MICVNKLSLILWSHEGIKSQKGKVNWLCFWLPRKKLKLNTISANRQYLTLFYYLCEKCVKSTPHDSIAGKKHLKQQKAEILIFCVMMNFSLSSERLIIMRIQYNPELSSGGTILLYTIDLFLWRFFSFFFFFLDK